MLTEKDKLKIKYVVNMPIQQKAIKLFLDDLLGKHYQKIILGEMEIWISPFIKKLNKEKFFQVFFDLDPKLATEKEIYTYMSRIWKNEEFKKNFSVVYSGNGYHVMSNFFIRVSSLMDMEVKAWIHNQVKNKIPGLDINIIRDNPLRRFGYRKDLEVWALPVEKELKKPKVGAKTVKPENVDLRKFIEEKLVPWKKTINVKDFEKMSSTIF